MLRILCVVKEPLAVIVNGGVPRIRMNIGPFRWSDPNLLRILHLVPIGDGHVPPYKLDAFSNQSIPIPERA